MLASVLGKTTVGEGAEFGSHASGLADSTAQRVLKTLVHIPIGNLKIGDVIVTLASNTRRKILSRKGNRFHFLTTQEFRGHSALNWNFSREKGGKILTKEDVTSLPLGTQLYGPKDVLMELIEIKDNGSTAVFRYEETKNVSQEQIQGKRYVVQRPVV